MRHNTNSRVLAAAIAAVVLLAAGLNLAAWLMRSHFMTAAQKAAQNPVTFYPAENAPPEPRLEANPLADLQALHDKEDALLNRYRWIDKSKGIVQIPVDRAMALLARRGLPARRGKAD